MNNSTSPTKVLKSGRSLWQAALEMSVVALFGLLYCAALFSGEELSLSGLDPNNRLPGIEHERLSGILIPIEIGLGLTERTSGIGHLPAWNPYMGTGTPLLNDAFLYLFNPFMSLPVLLLGAVQGTKIALIIGLLLAGVNMWALARALGLGCVARVMTGALYMLSGGIIGKFVSGHFQLGLSLVWLPLVLAGLWWTLHTRDRRAPALLALAFALLFFSGNIYYTLHTLVCCAVISMAYLFHREAGRWHIHTDKLRRLLIGGLLALGLCMIQFLPIWTVRDFVSHEKVNFDPDTGQIVGAYDLGVSLSNFITPWSAWDNLQDPPTNLLASVDYAYIGPAPFFLIAAVMFTGLSRHRKLALIALLLAVIMMVWGSGQTVIVRELYRRIPLLAEFRYIGRANSAAALWWIVLAGIALDNLRSRLPSAGLGRYDRARLERVLALAVVSWGWFLMYSGSNNSIRLALALNNIGLFNTLNNYRLTTYPQALGTLIGLIALVIILDTLLMPLHLRLSQKKKSMTSIARALAIRLARAGLLLLALFAIADVLDVNRQTIRLGPPGNSFGRLYSETLSAGIVPFPSIQEPFGPSTYDIYYSRIRSWGLNEGWLPSPVRNDIIPEPAPKLLHLPDWAIVSTEFQQGGTYELARAFAETHQGELVICSTRDPLNNRSDPCDIENHAGSMLYRLPQALPYAFIADEETLLTRADTLNSSNTPAITTLNHQMDTITVQAAMPEDGRPYYLIVQETHFPGWQAWIGDKRLETVTVGARTPGGPLAGFIGVPMQPGTNTYILRFEPPGFTAGILLSFMSLIGMLLYLSGMTPPHLVRRPETK